MSTFRNLTIDIARGFIVLIMPAVHVALFYGVDSVKVGPLGLCLQFFAEGPGAPLFMFLMGFSLVLGRRKTPRSIFKRSVALFVAGYALNFLKFILPFLFGMIPTELLTSYGISADIFGMLDLLLIGDILQFAAIAYLLCGLLYLWKFGMYGSAILAIVVIFFSPSFWGHRTHIILFDIFVKLFNGLPPAEFFPFFPWGVYPLFGLLFGYIFLATEESFFYSLVFKIGLGFSLSGFLITFFEPASYNKIFYRLGPGGTIFHVGIVLLWIRFCYLLANRFHDSRFVLLLRILSRRITLVYIVQWILICWLLSFFGFNSNNLLKTSLEIILISTLTFLLVFIIEKSLPSIDSRVK